HRAVLYNRLGEIAGEYVRKGGKIYVEGSLRTRKWQDQQGVERYTTEIIVSDMQLLDGRGATSGDVAPQASQNRYQPKDRPQANAQQAAPSPISEPEGFELLDDDIPF
ncbi:single-stranded DNA-binding protein, partial [bacterium]|nr:single-stranded DNA-binding protein [bacterium]